MDDSKGGTTAEAGVCRYCHLHLGQNEKDRYQGSIEISVVFLPLRKVPLTHLDFL